jgi:hypothetical protein
VASIRGRGYARLGSDWVRKVTGYLLIVLVAAGCRAATLSPTSAAGRAISIHESPSPFTGITAGDVHALIPDGWEAHPAGTHGGFEQGFIASPPAEPRGRVPAGMAAVWMDGTRIGVPSDYYYLAAKHAAVDRLTHATGCVTLAPRILANHRPAFANGGPNSPGDYVAYGQGVCSTSEHATRFAYFVAAPGYGPLHRVGIPASGLYMVVAMVPDSPDAPGMLRKLLAGTQFGTASVGDLIHAAEVARGL